MDEELFELIMGEEGFLVKLRCDNRFDEEMFAKIKYNLKKLVEVWKNSEVVSKKTMLALIEIQSFLSRNSIFVADKDAIRVEDACLELADIINELY